MRQLTTLLIISIALFTAGCGQKGPLYQPADKGNTAQQVAPK